MAGPFEAYENLDDIEERLQGADPAERRVAVIELANSGDPAAVKLLAGLVGDPASSDRQQAVTA